MKPDLRRIEAALQQMSDPCLADPPTDIDSAQSRRAIAPSFKAASPDQAEQSCFALSAPSVNAPNLLHFVSPIVPGNGNRRAFGHPALAMNLLSTLQTTVRDWATALQETIEQIEAVYAEGPIVDGWLETDPALAAGHDAEVGYRLCGLNDDGQIWYRPCPQEQIPDVSWAIARCQRLHNLLSQKRALETKLCGLTDSLITLHGQTIHS